MTALLTINNAVMLPMKTRRTCTCSAPQAEIVPAQAYAIVPFKTIERWCVMTLAALYDQIDLIQKYIVAVYKNKKLDF
jgi:hypothetical protein